MEDKPRPTCSLPEAACYIGGSSGSQRLSLLHLSSLCGRRMETCTSVLTLTSSSARIVKHVHPLPHLADCLVALGGKALFRTMDFTSGFYKVPLIEDDKKFTALPSPSRPLQQRSQLYVYDDEYLQGSEFPVSALLPRWPDLRSNWTGGHAMAGDGLWASVCA